MNSSYNIKIAPVRIGVTSMTAVTENDLKKLEDLIVSRFTAMETRLNSIESRCTGMETRLTSIETRLTSIETDVGELKANVKSLDEKVRGIEIQVATSIGKIDGLRERMDDLNSRLNGMTVGFLSIVGVLVTGILGIIGKVVFFPNNP